MTRSAAYAALVIAAGFLSAAVAPAAAEPTDHQGASAERTDKPGKPIALTKPVAGKKVARSRGRAKLAVRSRKATPVAAKSERRKIIEAKAETDAAAAPAALPATVANARAQLPAASAGTNPMEVAAADQLNELDRALNEPAVKIDDAKPTIAILAVRPAPEPAPPALAVAEPSNPTPWDRSSLVGKMFIALGGMLTLASAARMLIA